MTGQNGHERIDRVPRIYSGVGRPGQPRRPARRHHRRVRQHDPRRPGLLLRRHRPPAGPEAGRGPRPAAPRRLLDARPLGRRLRLGHHQQGHRHHRRQRLRQGRAGLSQVRLGEEGPADDLLPDDRRLAHLHALRARARRPGLHQRPDGDPQPAAPLKGLVPGGAIFMQSPYADPREVWKRIPEHNRRTIRDKKLRVYFCDMVKIAREVASEADLQMRMQGIVLLGAFLKLTPYAAESQMTDEQVYAGRREGPAEVLRQARRPRGAGQPHLRQARLQRDPGDPARAHQCLSRPPACLRRRHRRTSVDRRPHPSFRVRSLTLPRRSRCRRPLPARDPR